MKTTTKRTETVERETSVYHCDFCGSELATELFKVARVEMKCETGTAYPEGGTTETQSIDCCVTCWREKVLPSLARFGVTPRHSEIDW